MTPHAERIVSLADSRRDKFVKHGVAGRLFSFALLEFIGHCKQQGVPIGIEELRFILSRLDLGSFDCPFTIPQNVARFMAEVAASRSPKSILDPWAGIGFLAADVHNLLHPEIVVAYTKMQMEHQVFQLLEESSQIKMVLADPLQSLQSDASQFDLAIGCPPFGMGTGHSLYVEIDGQSETITDNYGLLLVLEACRHLTSDGIGVFVVPNCFLLAAGRKSNARGTLEKLGIRIVAAVELPAGTFQPRASNLTHIVVLERSTSTDIFAARFTDDEKQRVELLRNLKEKKPAKASQLGRIVPMASFRGFAAIELQEQVDEQARRMGLIAYRAKDVFTEVNPPAPKAEFVGFEEKANAVYLPQMASTAATTTQQDLPERLKSYFQLVVDPAVADAEFLARILNTPFGQLWRDSLRTGDIIPRISKSLLNKSTVFLPPTSSRQIQGKAIECQHVLSRLRNELNELETQLWKRPSSVDKVQASLRTVNKDDRIEHWLDSLPFPLASILWVAHTQTGSRKELYERKLHFFEALAEFLGVIHLSAYSLHQALWSELQKTLKEVLQTGKHSLGTATFGTWKTVVEFFFAETRRLMAKEEELAFELFKTRNRQVLDLLSSKRLVSVIQSTNKLRNDWIGHTGIVSEREAQSVNDLLDKHLQVIREVFGVTWDDYQLLLPGDCKVRSGVFHFSAKKIMGTRTPFPKQDVTVVEPMEDGHLHLKGPTESRGLRLLPFVKVMPSPKTEENACYFYNRQQSNGIRFLSYYFETDAEVVAEFGDVAIALGHLFNASQ